jgi:hypothetical protein
MLTAGTNYRIAHLVGQAALGAVYATVDLRLNHTGSGLEIWAVQP